MTHFLGRRDDAIWQRIARDIRGYQRDDGSWALYAGAPGDLSTTIECYFALRLIGDTGAHIDRAHRFILDRGGIAGARVFTRIWLALCGEWSWDDLPMMPLELMLLPARAPISIYRFSSWARATIVPLLDPDGEAPGAARARARELVRPPRRSGRAAVASLHDRRLFLAIDGVLRRYQHAPWHPRRERALAKAERWILDHQEADGSWGGIQPPWVYSLMALHALGHATGHAGARARARGHARPVDGPETDGRPTRASVPLAGVGHRARARRAAESGVPASEPAICEGGALAARNEEVRVPGDWCIWVADVQPSGWSFEFENDLLSGHRRHSHVVLALHRAGALDPETRARSLRWIFAMQSASGGWAAFDKDNTSRIPATDPVRRLRRDDRPAERRRDRARRRDARRARASSARTRRRARARVSVRTTRTRGLVVRALGRQPRLRHRRRPAGARGDRRADGQPRSAACGALARDAPEQRRRLRRGLRVVRRARGARPRSEHAVADRMGAARIRRRGPDRFARGAARS